MKTIEIKHRHTAAVLYSTEVVDDDAYPIRTALERAVAARADLADAYLARANLARANLAGANLAGADLADANLADANLAGADLAGADLAGADLAGADLADANLAGANLAGADLARANLAGANLAGARHTPAGVTATDPPTPYKRAANEEERKARQHARMLAFRARHPEVPVVEGLDARILAIVEKDPKALDMSTWHSCETTHCRAGWAIHLAGEAGYALEKQTNAQHAGAMIYRASAGRVPHFFATNERAMEDLRRCAEEQRAELGEKP
jgi:hypothetical protein